MEILEEIKKTELVRVLRIIEYVGERQWVETTVAKSIHGTMDLGKGKTIKAATIGEYPEILEQDDDSL